MKVIHKLKRRLFYKQRLRADFLQCKHFSKKQKCDDFMEIMQRDLPSIVVTVVLDPLLRLATLPVRRPLSAEDGVFVEDVREDIDAETPRRS